MSKQVYKCEKCDSEFNDNYLCMQHEVECLNENDLIKLSFEKAVKRLREDYSINFDSGYEALVWIDECDGFIMKNVSVCISGNLKNGHRIMISDSHFQPTEKEEVSEDDFYEYIEKYYILPFLDTKYEGEVSKRYSDYGDSYVLGELSISEICRRFYGKKVRIEVIS